jgi:hypothetical protein
MAALRMRNERRLTFAGASGVSDDVGINPLFLSDVLIVVPPWEFR